MIVYNAFKVSKSLIIFVIALFSSQLIIYGQLDSKVKKEILSQLNHLIENDQKYRWMIMYGETNQQKLDSILKLPFEESVKILRKQGTPDYKLCKNELDSLWKLQDSIDNINFCCLKNIIFKVGWLDKKRFGENDAYLILIHGQADSIKSIHSFLLNEVKLKRLEPETFAYIWDRMLNSIGEDQLYGTIFNMDEAAGVSEPPIIKNITISNIARKEIGLKKLKKYINKAETEKLKE